MTVALGQPTDTATDTAADESLEAGSPAGWWERAGAFGIDVLCPLAVVATALLTLGAMLDWPLLWLCAVLAATMVVVLVVNRLVLPSITGWSLGRSVFGIAVQDAVDGTAPGLGRLALRDLAHVLDTVPLALGWLWPLLDPRGRTFADMLAHTEVRRVDGSIPDRRRLATIVIATATALSVLAAGLGYAAVYRHQQSLAAARHQLADQGPDLVSDMLSYTVKTAPDDFAHAQTLVTDGYRPQLIQQQDAVKKSGLVDNDYWVSNSSVLSASAERASMLVLLQGQRGVPPKQRFVTASLRVDYEKTGDGWKVSNLTVLGAPKPAPAAAPPAQASTEPKPAPTPQPVPPKPVPPKPGTGGR